MTGRDVKVYDHVSGRLSETDRIVVHHVPPGGNWRDLPEDFPSDRVRQIRSSAARGEGSRSTYYGRLAWERPAYTISTYITRPGNGCFIHPQADRLITVREAARLQSFPDNIRFHGTMRQRSMQIGNAVPPLLAYHLGQSVEKGTAIDLFAGAGGLGLGLGWAGHEMVLSVDNDLNALKTLAGHASPDHRVEAHDLSNEQQFQQMVESARTALAGRELGTLAGGPPCQGFSTAGPCRVDDPRNKLVLSFLKAVEALRPRNVVFENVPALRWRGKQFLDELLERLEALGYVAELSILHSEAYGVPQLRRRLVVRASRGGQIAWPKPTHSLITPFFVKDQPGPLINGSSMPTVRQAIGDLPRDESDDLDAAVYTQAATSDYGRWLRGELRIEELVHDGRTSMGILEKAS